MDLHIKALEVLCVECGHSICTDFLGQNSDICITEIGGGLFIDFECFLNYVEVSNLKTGQTKDG